MAPYTEAKIRSSVYGAIYGDGVAPYMAPYTEPYMELTFFCFVLRMITGAH